MNNASILGCTRVLDQNTPTSGYTTYIVNIRLAFQHSYTARGRQKRRHSQNFCVERPHQNNYVHTSTTGPHEQKLSFCYSVQRL